jgi:hypothetical protein
MKEGKRDEITRTREKKRTRKKTILMLQTVSRGSLSWATIIELEAFSTPDPPH